MPRRLAILAAAALSIAGCSNLRDAFSAHADVVARAAGQELTVNRLAELLAPQKQVPLRRDVMDRVAELWVDYQLLGHAIAVRDSLTDTATAMAASWPAVMQRLANQLHDSVVGSRSRLSSAQVDSAYNAGAERWLEHILVAARQDTTPEVKAAKRRTAAGYLAQVRGGAPFARLASQRSDDPASAANGGSLGLVGRGVLVKAFEDAGWALQPGQISDVVETAFGYHIIRRPPLAEIRDSFTIRLRELAVGRMDSIFLDSLANKTGIRVRGSAPALVRSAVNDPRSAKRSGRVLATYSGGRLRARDFARWLQAFNPQTRQMVGAADDSTLKEFVKSIARNEMLLQMVRERNIQLAPADRDSIITLFRADLGLIVATVGVAAESLVTDSAQRLDRVQAASRRVDAYFAGITATPPQRAFVEVPPFLSDLLRERYAWSISPSGVDRALERATEIRGPETPSAPAPVVTPAPGGPPVGNAPPQPGTQPGGAPPPRR